MILNRFRVSRAAVPPQVMTRFAKKKKSIPSPVKHPGPKDRALVCPWQGGTKDLREKETIGMSEPKALETKGLFGLHHWERPWVSIHLKKQVADGLNLTRGDDSVFLPGSQSNKSGLIPA
ncbi:MAG: hypothetical protein JEZ11_09235 [Desulfobacterales bacterium]|nr:hypothetical protein [Desulfobacterales bacterium]